MGLFVVPLCAFLFMVDGGHAVRRKRAGSLKVESNASLLDTRWFLDPVWVTIGDSFASGLGIHTAHRAYEGGNTQVGCYRDWSNVPGAKYARANGIGFVNEACAFTYLSGVDKQLDSLATQYPLDTQNKWTGSIFHLTTGGNDLKTVRGETWEALLLRCVTNTNSCSRDPQNKVTNWLTLEVQLASLFTRVARFASGAKIRIVGYPRLMSFQGWCFAVPGMRGVDANWIDSMVDELNGRVLSAVTHVQRVMPNIDVQFIDMKNVVTRGACSWSNRQINGLVFSLPEGMSHATLHPQQSGYDAVLAALTANLR